MINFEQNNFSTSPQILVLQFDKKIMLETIYTNLVWIFTQNFLLCIKHKN